ncbi:hypothetical protein RA27_17885 [Ruegeria sp. ANG-R]|nr:hypothetical protein RA27_17885 [Ruegeria sp. ANG-R]
MAPSLVVRQECSGVVAFYHQYAECARATLFATIKSETALTKAMALGFPRSPYQPIACQLELSRLIVIHARDVINRWVPFQSEKPEIDGKAC